MLHMLCIFTCLAGVYALISIHVHIEYYEEKGAVFEKRTKYISIHEKLNRQQRQ